MHAYVTEYSNATSALFSTDATLTPHPDVVCTSLNNGESVLLHLTTHTYYSLNETGALIWALIEQNTPAALIGAALVERYAVNRAQVQESVGRLVTQLLTEKLVVYNDIHGQVDAVLR